jgi:hypothetical protein
LTHHLRSLLEEYHASKQYASTTSKIRNSAASQNSTFSSLEMLSIRAWSLV